MKKQEFTFVFPMSGDTTTKKLNPLAIKETAIRYLKGQSEIRGDVCIIKNSHKEVVAMAYLNEDMSVSFFTEDESVNDIVSLTEQEGGNNNE